MNIITDIEFYSEISTLMLYVITYAGFLQLQLLTVLLFCKILMLQESIS